MGQIVNAKTQYAARGDGVTNDAPSLGNAIAAAGAGGIVYVPHGTYLCSNLELLDGQTLLGDGPGTVLKRGPTKPNGAAHSGYVVEIVGKEATRIANVAIEVVTWSNFMTGIRVFDSVDTTIEGCTIYHSGLIGTYTPENGGGPWVAGPPWTLHSILAGDVDGLIVRGCFTRFMQMKLEGSRILCQGNVIREPWNLGISSVCFTDDGEVIRDVSIIDNLIVDPHGHGGIFVGSDVNYAALAEYHNLIVRGNQVVGAYDFSGGNQCGILARPPRRAVGWIIEGNVLRPDSYAGSNCIGISMANVEGAQVERSIVRGNVIENFDQRGIAISGELKDVIVAENVVHATRGIQVSSSGSGASWASLRGNHIRGGYQGIHAIASAAELNVEVAGNVCHDITSDGSGTESGIRLEASGGETLRATVRGNRCRAVAYGVREQGAGAHDNSVLHNDLRGCTTPLSVGQGAYLHENRSSQ